MTKRNNEEIMEKVMYTLMNVNNLIAEGSKVLACNYRIGNEGWEFFDIYYEVTEEHQKEYGLVYRNRVYQKVIVEGNDNYFGTDHSFADVNNDYLKFVK